MKKLNILSMAVATILFAGFALSACGGSTGSTQSNGGDEGPPNQTNQSHKISFTHFWPSHHIVHTNVVEPFKAEIEEKTGGRITVDLYPAAALGNPQELYDLAVAGAASISLSVHGYTPGKFPLMSVGDLPFMSRSSQEGSEVIWNLYKEFPELQQEHEDVTALWMFTGEPNQLLSAKKPIETLEDMKGLKIRSPSPLTSKIIEALGGVPVSMPVNDIYEAMDKGVIDAAMAGMSTLNDMNLHEVVDYVTIGNFSNSTMFVVMNTNTFTSLSDSDKELFTSYGDTLASKTGVALDEGGVDGYNKAVESGITFIELDGGKFEPWKQAVKPIVEEWIAEMKQKGLPGQEVYDRAVEITDELRKNAGK